MLPFARVAVAHPAPFHSSTLRLLIPAPCAFSLQVREFDTVEGQEWWHNDARSSQATPLDMGTVPADLCVCGGVGGLHGPDCCWRMT